MRWSIEGRERDGKTERERERDRNKDKERERQMKLYEQAKRPATI